MFAPPAPVSDDVLGPAWESEFEDIGPQHKDAQQPTLSIDPAEEYIWLSQQAWFTLHGLSRVTASIRTADNAILIRPSPTGIVPTKQGRLYSKVIVNRLLDAGYTSDWAYVGTATGGGVLFLPDRKQPKKHRGPRRPAV